MAHGQWESARVELQDDSKKAASGNSISRVVIINDVLNRSLEEMPIPASKMFVNLNNDSETQFDAPLSKAFKTFGDELIGKNCPVWPTLFFCEKLAEGANYAEYENYVC